MMMASAWYRSDIFWTGAGVACTLFIGIITAWVTLRSRFPKKRLFYRLSKETPLLETPAGIQTGLEILHQGAALSNPHIAEIIITSRGREDIASEGYDSGTPLRFHMGEKIIKVLDRSSSTPERAAPTPSIENSTLSIGPALIKKDQKITYMLLVDGPSPNFSCESSLVNVEVREKQVDDDQRRGDNIACLGFIFLLISIAGISAGVTYAFTKSDSTHTDRYIVCSESPVDWPSDWPSDWPTWAINPGPPCGTPSPNQESKPGPTTGIEEGR
jgi:hypothetical protein